MPRLSNVSAKNSFHAVGRRYANTLAGPVFANWFVTMTKITGTGYIERFIARRKTCYYAEYYVVDNLDGTHNLYAYIQLHPVSAAFLITLFNCRTTLIPTTISHKLCSDFESVPDKVCLGTQKVGCSGPHPVDNPVFSLIPTRVAFGAAPVSKSCWLPQPPKSDPCLNRKKIYPINYDV